METIFSGLRVEDVMLRHPKTLPSSARVREARSLLENPSVQIVLLVDGLRFAGAITEMPASADDNEDALRYADPDPPTLTVDASAQTAFELAAGDPHRRAVVLGNEHELLGLVCLDETRTRFCGRASRGSS